MGSYSNDNANNVRNACGVYSDGYLHYYGGVEVFGVRPVITIVK